MFRSGTRCPSQGKDRMQCGELTETFSRPYGALSLCAFPGLTAWKRALSSMKLPLLVLGARFKDPQDRSPMLSLFVLQPGCNVQLFGRLLLAA